MGKRAAALILQVGVVAAVLIALPYKLFELDRFFVPKELVLHAAALILAITLISSRQTRKWDFADAFLALFLAWSAASALFATNPWLAQRALAVSLSSAVIFWGARKLGETHSYRILLDAAAVATVCAAAAALAQAYGMNSDYFTTSRMPGGTLGNRNFVAHLAAIGLPTLIWCTVTTKHRFGVLLGSLGGGLVAAALVLSRSRAAWLAVAAAVLVLAGPVMLSSRYWRGGLVGGRLARFLLAGFVATAAAIALPNRLNWHSDSPYLDTARGVVDYSRGSGKGRLQQYENSARMAMDNPAFGVGPGNWPVRYVRFAPPDDRSIADDGMTANPWPSSDWVAFLSERGVIAAGALLGALLILFLGAFTSWRGAAADVVLLKLALAGTVIAAMVVGSLDVTLLLAAPAFLIWMILGAAAGATRARTKVGAERIWTIGGGLAVLILAASAFRSAAQIVAMTSVGDGSHRAGWVNASRWDPGSYRIAIRTGELYANRGQCSNAHFYAERASSLFPSAPAARRLMRRCP